MSWVMKSNCNTDVCEQTFSSYNLIVNIFLKFFKNVLAQLKLACIFASLLKESIFKFWFGSSVG